MIADLVVKKHIFIYRFEEIRMTRENAVIYVRVSTSEQKAESQIKPCKSEKVRKDASTIIR